MHWLYWSHSYIWSSKWAFQHTWSTFYWHGSQCYGRVRYSMTLRRQGYDLMFWLMEIHVSLLMGTEVWMGQTFLFKHAVIEMYCKGPIRVSNNKIKSVKVSSMTTSFLNPWQKAVMRAGLYQTLTISSVQNSRVNSTAMCCPCLRVNRHSLAILPLC